MATECTEPAIRLGEWFVIGATALGPILAVQAQKWIERAHAKAAMKDGIFRTLMATRATRLSASHVEALNMIPIAFYGRRFLGRQRQTNNERRVCVALREYFDNLGTNTTGYTEAQNQTLYHDRDEKFTSLLETIANAQNFDFDRVELRRSVYAPVHHGVMEGDHEAIRSGLAKILKGDAALKMNVVNLPQQQ